MSQNHYCPYYIWMLVVLGQNQQYKTFDKMSISYNIVTLNMTNKCTSKPVESYEKAKESNNTCTSVQVTVAELTHYLKEGRSFCPAMFNGKRSNANWIGQSVFCLDFDNGVQPSAIIERCQENNIIVNILYTTFSDKPEHRKFRVVFFLDVEIKSKDKATLLQESLLDLFPEADQVCRDGARLFFAAKEIYHFNDTINSIYDLADIVNKFKAKIEVKEVKVDTPKETIFKSTAKISKDNFNFDLAVMRIEILRSFLEGEWLYHKELFGLATNLRYVNGGLDLMVEVMTKHNESGKTNYGEDKFRLIRQVAKGDYKSQRLCNFSQYLGDHKWNNIFQACLDK